MNYKIAFILPTKNWDYLANSLMDGLLQIQKEKNIEFFVSSKGFHGIQAENLVLKRNDFVKFAAEADLIFLVYGKGDMDTSLAQEINKWDKTIFIDGSELGRDRRYDLEIQQKVLTNEWVDHGKIDQEMLSKCILYFRREKPYVEGIIPLPYGIESRYMTNVMPIEQKDIDFVCMFGQEQHPILRKDARLELEKYCAANNFSCFTGKIPETEYYKTLGRAKVGISVGGGGFDTARFWEILGNNCILLTENIDIYPRGNKELDYKRIFQFKDLQEFKNKLEQVGQILKSEYPLPGFNDEYEAIIQKHSSVARIETILNEAKAQNLI